MKTVLETNYAKLTLEDSMDNNKYCWIYIVDNYCWIYIVDNSGDYQGIHITEAQAMELRKALKPDKNKPSKLDELLEFIEGIVLLSDNVDYRHGFNSAKSHIKERIMELKGEKNELPG